jgi:hypothetical protein
VFGSGDLSDQVRSLVAGVSGKYEYEFVRLGEGWLSARREDYDPLCMRGNLLGRRRATLV